MPPWPQDGVARGASGRHGRSQRRERTARGGRACNATTTTGARSGPRGGAQFRPVHERPVPTPRRFECAASYGSTVPSAFQCHFLCITEADIRRLPCSPLVDECGTGRVPPAGLQESYEGPISTQFLRCYEQISMRAPVGRDGPSPGGRYRYPSIPAAQSYDMRQHMAIPSLVRCRTPGDCGGKVLTTAAAGRGGRQA